MEGRREGKGGEEKTRQEKGGEETKFNSEEEKPLKNNSFIKVFEEKGLILHGLENRRVANGRVRKAVLTHTIRKNFMKLQWLEIG